MCVCVCACVRARVCVCGVVCLGMCVHARAKILSARLRSSPPLLGTDLRHCLCGNYGVYKAVVKSIWCLLEGCHKYHKGTSIFPHLGALRKSPWKFIIWMNEL